MHGIYIVTHRSWFLDTESRIEGSSLAVLVVHEFKTDNTDENKHLQNHIELKKLLCVLSRGSVNDVDVGILYDEFNIDGMDFMIGKIITEL